MVLPGNEVTSGPSEGGEEWYLVTRSSVITGQDMRQQGASVGQDQNAGQPDVIFSLTNDGGRKFADFTGAHVGESLAVVLNHRVREAATIQEPDPRSGGDSSAASPSRPRRTWSLF